VNPGMTRGTFATRGYGAQAFGDATMAGRQVKAAEKVPPLLEKIERQVRRPPEPRPADPRGVMSVTLRELFDSRGFDLNAKDGSATVPLLRLRDGGGEPRERGLRRPPRRPDARPLRLEHPAPWPAQRQGDRGGLVRRHAAVQAAGRREHVGPGRGHPAGRPAADAAPGPADPLRPDRQRGQHRDRRQAAAVLQVPQDGHPHQPERPAPELQGLHQRRQGRAGRRGRDAGAGHHPLRHPHIRLPHLGLHRPAVRVHLARRTTSRSRPGPSGT
jgi:hypothetical protein